MKKLIDTFKDISNYLYIGRVIRKNKDTEEWKKLNLRVGYFNTIYMIVNLPPEVFEAPEDLHKLYILGEISKVSDYFTKLNLLEIVSAEQEKIDRVDGMSEGQRVDAYLITFPPIIKELNLWVIMQWVLVAGLICWAQARFELAQNCVRIVDGVISHLVKISS